MVGPDGDHRVLVARRSRHEPQIARSIKAKVETNHAVFKDGVFNEDPSILSRIFGAAQDSVLGRPFFLKVPAVTDLAIRKVITEVETSRRDKQRWRRDIGTDL